jgi:hypothetical protein
MTLSNEESKYESILNRNIYSTISSSKESIFNCNEIKNLDAVKNKNKE